MKTFTIYVPDLVDVCNLLRRVLDKIAPVVDAKPAPVEPEKGDVAYWVVLKGVTKAASRQVGIRNLKPTSDIRLKYENDSMYPNMVGVYCGNVKLGNLPDKDGSRGSNTLAKMVRDKFRDGKNPRIIDWTVVGGKGDKPRVGMRQRISNKW